MTSSEEHALLSTQVGSDEADGPNNRHRECPSTECDNNSEESNSTRDSLMHHFLEDSKRVALCKSSVARIHEQPPGCTSACNTSEVACRSDSTCHVDLLLELESSLRWAELELVTLALRNKEDLDEIAFWRLGTDAEVCESSSV